MVNLNNLRRGRGGTGQTPSATSSGGSKNMMQIVDEIANKPSLTTPSETVRREIIKFFREGQEEGVETSSFKVSLLDPISKKRIKIPVQSTKCDHFKCFDLQNFLDLSLQKGINEEAGGKSAWHCPHCQADAKQEQLRVDGYFQEILLKVSAEPQEVELFPDGSWKEVEQLDFKDVLLGTMDDGLEVVEMVPKKKPRINEGEPGEVLEVAIIPHQRETNQCVRCEETRQILGVLSSGDNLIEKVQKLKQDSDFVEVLCGIVGIDMNFEEKHTTIIEVFRELLMNQKKSVDEQADKSSQTTTLSEFDLKEARNEVGNGEKNRSANQENQRKKSQSMSSSKASSFTTSSSRSNVLRSNKKKPAERKKDDETCLFQLRIANFEKSQDELFQRESTQDAIARFWEKQRQSATTKEKHWVEITWPLGTKTPFESRSRHNSFAYRALHLFFQKCFDVECNLDPKLYPTYGRVSFKSTEDARKVALNLNGLKYFGCKLTTREFLPRKTTDQVPKTIASSSSSSDSSSLTQKLDYAKMSVVSVSHFQECLSNEERRQRRDVASFLDLARLSKEDDSRITERHWIEIRWGEVGLVDPNQRSPFQRPLQVVPHCDLHTLLWECFGVRSNMRMEFSPNEVRVSFATAEDAKKVAVCLDGLTFFGCILSVREFVPGKIVAENGSTSSATSIQNSFASSPSFDSSHQIGHNSSIRGDLEEGEIVVESVREFVPGKETYGVNEKNALKPSNSSSSVVHKENELNLSDRNSTERTVIFGATNGRNAPHQQRLSDFEKSLLSPDRRDPSLYKWLQSNNELYVSSIEKHWVEITWKAMGATDVCQAPFDYPHHPHMLLQGPSVNIPLLCWQCFGVRCTLEMESKKGTTYQHVRFITPADAKKVAHGLDGLTYLGFELSVRELSQSESLIQRCLFHFERALIAKNMEVEKPMDPFFTSISRKKFYALITWQRIANASDPKTAAPFLGKTPGWELQLLIWECFSVVCNPDAQFSPNEVVRMSFRSADEAKKVVPALDGLIYFGCKLSAREFLPKKETEEEKALRRESLLREFLEPRENGSLNDENQKRLTRYEKYLREETPIETPSGKEFFTCSKERYWIEIKWQKGSESSPPFYTPSTPFKFHGQTTPGRDLQLLLWACFSVVCNPDTQFSLDEVRVSLKSHEDALKIVAYLDGLIYFGCKLTVRHYDASKKERNNAQKAHLALWSKDRPESAQTAERANFPSHSTLQPSSSSSKYNNRFQALTKFHRTLTQQLHFFGSSFWDRYPAGWNVFSNSNRFYREMFQREQQERLPQVSPVQGSLPNNYPRHFDGVRSFGDQPRPY